MKDEREKRLLFKRHKAVRFLISPKKKKSQPIARFIPSAANVHRNLINA